MRRNDRKPLGCLTGMFPLNALSVSSGLFNGGIGEVVECRENAKMIRRERIARSTQSQIPGEAMQRFLRLSAKQVTCFFPAIWEKACALLEAGGHTAT